MYLRRKIEYLLDQALTMFPVILITGARQTGKSTLLRKRYKNYRYVTLDDPILRALAKEDPELFLKTHGEPLVIDEIQYAPELFPYLKLRIDSERRRMGRYLLTGSQIFQVMEGVTETLAGRIALFHLYPFCLEELGRFQEKIDDEEVMAKRLINGFYPEFFVNSAMDPQLWFSSYLATYVERDVRNIKAITDLARFQTFIRLCAARVGQLLNLSEIAKECGISQPTAKDWLGILESTYIIYLLKPYHVNHTKRLVKSPKLYFVDTGLLSYLLGLESWEQLIKAPYRGHLFENMVIMEMAKHLAYKKSKSELFFYRTGAGVEIDLLVESRGELAAYEIKFSKTPSKSMVRSLESFAKEHEINKAQLLSLRREPLKISTHVEAVHWSSVSEENLKR